MNKKPFRISFFLWGIFGISLGFSTNPLDIVAFPMALDMPRNQILDVHNCAIDVNTSPLQQDDQAIVFEEAPIAKQYQINEGNSLVLSFPNFSKEEGGRLSDQAPTIAESLREKLMNINKDVILTGYGYGANLAAWIAYSFGLYRDLFGPSQLKLIIFCAAGGPMEKSRRCLSVRRVF